MPRDFPAGFVHPKGLFIRDALAMKDMAHSFLPQIIPYLY